MTKLVNKKFNAEIVEQLTIWTDGVLGNDRKETSLLELFWDAGQQISEQFSNRTRLGVGVGL